MKREQFDRRNGEEISKQGGDEHTPKKRGGCFWRLVLKKAGHYWETFLSSELQKGEKKKSY
jgi:hypothetical protein